MIRPSHLLVQHALTAVVKRCVHGSLRRAHTKDHNENYDYKDVGLSIVLYLKEKQGRRRQLYSGTISLGLLHKNTIKKSPQLMNYETLITNQNTSTFKELAQGKTTL